MKFLNKKIVIISVCAFVFMFYVLYFWVNKHSEYAGKWYCGTALGFDIDMLSKNFSFVYDGDIPTIRRVKAYKFDVVDENKEGITIKFRDETKPVDLTINGSGNLFYRGGIGTGECMRESRYRELNN